MVNLFLKALFILTFTPSLVFASNYSIKTKLSSPIAEMGDRVVLTIEISSDEKQFRIDDSTKNPVVKGLEFLNRSISSSSNMVFSGGQRSVTYSQILNLFFTPTKLGRIKIPKIPISIEGRAVYSKAVVLEVVKELSSKQKKQKRRGRGRSFNLFDQGDDLINRFFRGFGTNEAPTEPEFFVDAEISTLNPYEAEQFLVKWYVYTNGALSQFDTLKFPTLKGFWKEDVEFAQNFRWERAEKEGKVYRRALMSSYALTAYKPGALEVDSFDLRATVSSTSFGFGRPKVFRVKSKAYDINVEPLPAPVPEYFNGGVGDFSVEVDEAPALVRVGEAFSLVVRLKGNESNAKFLKNIELDLGNGFKLYEKKEDIKFFPKQVSYIKRIEFVLIALNEGIQTIPDLRVNYFNTSVGDYESIYAQFPPLKVQRGVNSNLPDDILLSEEPLKPSASKSLSYMKTLSFKAKLISPNYMLLILPALVLFLISCAWSLFIVLKRQESQSFLDLLEIESDKLKILIKEKEYKLALELMINLVSLGTGALSGKRFGVDRTFEQSLEALPISLAGYKKELINLNTSLQEMRFARLSLQDKNKIEESYNAFLSFKDKVIKYLRKD